MIRLLLPLFAAALWFPVAIFAADEPKTAAVSQITVQRTQCYGPCPVDTVTFNANRTATYSGISGNTPRRGLFRGELGPRQFADLVAFLESQNFFELRAEIGRGMATDVPEFLVSAVRDGQAYNVTFHFDRNPTLEAKMRKVLLNAAESVVWERDEVASAAGVRGTAYRPLTPRETRLFRDRQPPIETFPLAFGQIYLRSLDHPGIEMSTRSDQEGQFQFFAPPGRYEMSSRSADASDLYLFDATLIDVARYYAKPQKIEVEVGKFAAPQLYFVDINTSRFEK